MPISLRCPGCGKVYRLADDRAGKQAKCPCGAVMKVPAEASKDGPAWEEEVIRAFGPSGESGPKQTGPHQTEPEEAGPPGSAPAQRPAAVMPAPPAPRPEADAAPRGKKRAADSPPPLSSRIASFAKIDLRRLVKKDPWRAIVGLATVAYGVAAAPLILAGISEQSIGSLLFGDTARRLAQAGLAVGIAVGGLFILKKDKRGPVCAGLAAVLFCFVPMWGPLPEIYDAIQSDQFVPFLWVAVRYAVPVALMVWCLKEQTAVGSRQSV
jgi:hypothetical protein